MRIIPAIDIIEGKAVRLEKGDFNKKKIYADDPLDMAMQFQDAGIKYLHLVDLDGAKIGKVVNQSILEKIKSKTNLIIDFGGGIRSIGDLESLFNAGADQVNIGSLAVKEAEKIDLFLERYEADKIILSPDVKGHKIAIHGWQEESQLDVFEYINDFSEKGISYYVCTDIEKDGMLSGSSIELYQEIIEKNHDIKLIASGGVTEITELDKLSAIGIDGVIIGKAIYEGRITLKNLESYVS